MGLEQSWQRQPCISPAHYNSRNHQFAEKPFGTKVHHHIGRRDLNMAMRQVDAVPGSIQLIDLDGTSTSKHAAGRVRDVVLTPVPSEHPDDPLNWSPNRKRLSIASVCLYVAVHLPTIVS